MGTTARGVIMESHIKGSRLAIRRAMCCVAVPLSLVLWPDTGLSQQRNRMREAKEGKGEIVAVFITGSCCTALVPTLRPGIERLREKLRAQADSEGVGFRLIGVSNDWNTD